MGPTLCCKFEKLILALMSFPEEMKIRQWKKKRRNLYEEEKMKANVMIYPQD